MSHMTFSGGSKVVKLDLTRLLIVRKTSNKVAIVLFPKVLCKGP